MPSSTSQFTILGASGFVGSALTASLRARGHEVFAPTRADPAVFQRSLGHVIYCIGMTADFRSKPFETVDAHVGVLAEVLGRASFDSLLYLSSTRVYGNAARACEDAQLLVNPNDPSDLYNLSKLTGEALCRSCGKSGVRVARLSNVVGPDPESPNFLSSLVREALAGRIELRSDPASAKDYVLLEDVVDLLPAIAVAGEQWLYNVASGAAISHAQLVSALVSLTGCQSAVVPGSPRFDFPEIDIARIRTEFRFTPSPILGHLPRLVDAVRRHLAPSPQALE